MPPNLPPHITISDPSTNHNHSSNPNNASSPLPSALRTSRPRGNTRLTLPSTPSKPPKWQSRPTSERIQLICFGTLLSLIAGYINGTTLFGAFGTTVSHTTGSSTKLGIAIAEGDGESIGLFIALVGAFMLGGAVAGGIVGEQGFRWSRRYGWVLMLEAGFLAMAWGDDTPWERDGKEGGLDVGRGAIWAAFACGLQNAVTTTFSGAVIRTTHTTGLITDIGVVLGQTVFHWEQGKAHVWKLTVFVPLYLGFVLGGCLAVVGHRTIGEKGLLVLAGVLFVGGAIHAGLREWRQWMVSRKKDREWEAAWEDDFGREEGDGEEETDWERERYRDDPGH